MKRVPVEVTGISVCAPYQGYVVVLREKDGQRLLPIFIGGPEANNIQLLLQGLKYLRPLTYDLFYSILEAANTKVERVTVTDLRDNTFFAEVQIVTDSGKTKGIDARPSDAIALAIKSKAPIFVYSKVLEEAGLIGEDSNNQVELSEQLRDLNQELSQAVEKEAYEYAAKLRDQIKNLESKVKTE